jgi:heme iron utilization protein
MDVEVLPGPSLAERARTAVAQARLAEVTWEDPEPGRGRRVTATAAIRVDGAGAPVLLLAPRETVTEALAESPVVTATIPAPAPLGSLALTGRLWPRAETGGRLGYRLDLWSLRFAGGGGAPVRLADYRDAEPDPLGPVAGRAVQHLERGHLAELISCVRAHGMHQAEWVVPRGLDRFGLELAVISPNGVAAVRLSFPDGPVGSLEEVPASLRAVLACRCRSARPEPEPG